MQQVIMRNHQILHRDIGFVIWFDNIGVLCNLRKAHGKRLTHGPNLFYRNLNFFGNLIIGNVRILNKILSNFKIKVRIGPRNFNKPTVVPEVV